MFQIYESGHETRMTPLKANLKKNKEARFLPNKY